MKSYFDCLNELDSEDLYKGLLANGLFNAKLPDIFTSEEFYKHCADKNELTNIEKTDWIRFENNRNNSLPRTLGIPNPFAYKNQCDVLKKYWNVLLDYFKSNASCNSNTQKVSRSHIRKLKGTSAIFEMNYKNISTDGSIEPFDYIDSRYVVEADISKCFESIYTHAIAWALVGKTNAKKNKDCKKEYQNLIDTYSQKTTNGETHGLLIGPVSSNLLSEIILCKIDNNLKHYKYYRIIDDYRCYVRTLEEANLFIIDLKKALYEYGLTINDKKVKIHSISEYNSNNLSHSIHKYDYLLNYKKKYKSLDYNQVESYLGIIDELFRELNNNCSVYFYAFKLLKSKNLSMNARKYFVDKAMNLSIVYPYLLFTLNDTVFSIHGVTQNIGLFCKTLYEDGKKESNFEKCCYGLYFGLINSIADVIDEKNLEEDFENCDDCITRIFMWLYCKNMLKQVNLQLFENQAKKIFDIDDDFNRNWLYVYEVLGKEDFEDKIASITDKKKRNDMNDWLRIKEKNVSFINYNKIVPQTHWKSLF